MTTMEKETCTFSFCKKPEIETVETDLLLIGGGMACCGAAFEGARWANPKKIKITMVDKAATDRSGAVAMGLSAINTYMGGYGSIVLTDEEDLRSCRPPAQRGRPRPGRR